MEGAILHTDSENDLKLILELAKKLGVSTKRLTKSEMEDFGLANAISKARTGEYIETEDFLNELIDGRKD